MTASRFAALLALAGALASSAALAQESGSSGGGAWSIESAVPAGTGRIALGLQAGWPRIEARGWYGFNDRVDLGGKLAFTWGRDGSFAFGPATVPGVRFQGAARMELFRSGVVRLAGQVAPGIGIDAFPGYSYVRILLPVSIALGIAPRDGLLIHGGIDIAAYLTPQLGFFTLPLLIGGGAEYALSDALHLTGNVKMGPAIELTQNGAARFALEILVGVAYRL